MKTRILSWLLYHANRKPSKEFYEIKDRILGKYGNHVCYDVQHFQPVKCNDCRGTGRFKSYWKPPERCWSCNGTGWYKPESWVILARIRFGKYDCFHRPMNRVFERPEFSNPMIESYIEKNPTRYSTFARGILFLIYEKGYLKRWYRHAGHGWRLQWWLPANCANNLIHIVKYGYKAIPFRRFRSMRSRLKERSISLGNNGLYYDFDDTLPF